MWHHASSSFVKIYMTFSNSHGGTGANDVELRAKDSDQPLVAVGNFCLRKGKGNDLEFVSEFCHEDSE